MKYLLVFLSFLAINQCNEKKKETHFINGNAPGVANGMRVYLNDLDQNGRTVIIDTSIVMEESFFFDKKEQLSSEEVRFLTLDGSEGNFIILVQNSALNIRLKKDSLYDSEVIGSKSNQALKTFKKQQTSYASQSKIYRDERAAALRSNDNTKATDVTAKWTQAEKDFKEYAIETITSNNSSVIAPMILGELLNSKFIDAAKSREIYNDFNTQVKQSVMAQRIDAYLKKTESVAIGAKAPEFEGTSPDGSIIKLSDVLGKVTLIDFWASWCGPCRRENPNVVAAYNKYHEKGFNIISVSLDKKNGEKAWKEAIVKDKMDWNHVSRLMYFGPLAKLYNVNAIPATFLLDENGIIIATNLRGQQLHNKLEELLGNS
ncbi:redoxin domain-containing protein [Nonlabens sp.]|uniref:redoxin domain-containing protein n=1 Tax=Nonlabens sp. TaxID=1888209 RepID=UPI003F6A284D